MGTIIRCLSKNHATQEENLFYWIKWRRRKETSVNEWETGDFFYFFFENVLGCDAQFIIFVQDILTNGYHSNFAEPLIKKREQNKQ